MSTRDTARRTFPPLRGRRQQPAGGRPSGSEETLPERLVAAREAKGVDLLRAERETKIRRAYLAALESGDYAQLPGSVYARGFIRNYALYLGLDPEQAVAMYVREHGDPAANDPVLVVPKGVQAPRRPLVIPTGLIAAGLVALAAVAILAYIAFQLVRFAEPPGLAVTDPAESVVTVAEKTTAYTLRGTTIPGGEVTIDVPGRDSIQVTAGSDGAWLKTVDLRNGKNQFVITARDPKTQSTAKEPVQLIINVPLSAVLAPTLTVDSPAEGASFQNGAIPVSGHTSNATAVTVSAAFVAPDASLGPSSRPASNPRPVNADVADDGSFSSSLDLTAGSWAVSVTALSDAGKTTTVTRSITVAYKGVVLVIDVKGGRAWMKLWVDGGLSAQTGAGGKTFQDGDTLTIRADQKIEVWTGNPAATYFTLNGTRLGALGTAAAPQTWLFQPPNPPKQTNRRN